MTKVQDIYDGSVENLPGSTRLRLLKTFDETQQILDKAGDFLVTKLSGKLSFTYESSDPLPEMTQDERAQSICFVTRYKHLPILKRIETENIRSKRFRCF